MGKGKRAKKLGSQGKRQPSYRQITDSCICKLVDDLWKLLQRNPSEQLQFLWDEYDEIQVIVENLREVQSPVCSPLSRSAGLPEFEKWLQDHGAAQDNVEIVEIPGVEFGLRTKRELKREEKVLSVPKKLMMSSETALDGVLGVLISRDRMLQAMPNVSLALHLLNEKNSPSSFWKPYIDILPRSFSLPLFFSKSELSMLRGSPCLVKSLLQIRNIVKLYAHLHRIIRVTEEESLALFKCGFRYDDFIWAVSCVMSRQNEIPSKAGPHSPALALIPLWDLCNHCSGHISTFFNLECQTCDCYAQHNFKANEEFTIFYGPRTNSELLLQQGFVYPDNEHDVLPIRLGISSAEEEEIKKLRIRALQSLNVQISGTFNLSKSSENPFSPDLRGFVRIFTAPVEVLEQLGRGSAQNMHEHRLKDAEWKSEDLKVLEFLEKRCLLILRSYTTSIVEDERLVADSSPSLCATQAILARKCEKEILMNAIQYAQKSIEELNKITKSLNSN